MFASSETSTNPLGALLALASTRPTIPVGPVAQPVKTVATLEGWKAPREIPPARTQWTSAVLTKDGRIVCNDITRKLGWEPNTHLDVALRGLRIELTPAGPGAEGSHAPRIDARGRLCVPPRWRQAMRAEPGDDVLLSLDANANSVAIASQRVVSYLFDELEKGLAA